MRRRAITSAVVVAGAVAAVLVTAFGALAGHTNTVLEASLDGRSEIATGATNMRIVGDPDGRGEVYVFGIDGDPTTLCYVLLVDRIAPATAAHIHEAPAGQNGPVVANLAAPADGDAADCLTEGEQGKFPTGEKVADILANPTGYYVNVHTADYPGGAVRGQLRGH
ncbi:MAG: CHRD domain-containing protein [Gaiellaceae bacterium]|jgi:hypothetical protein|nr:MAG: CHRD domain-containing protein [Gaiellaceae bacterium]